MNGVYCWWEAAAHYCRIGSPATPLRRLTAALARPHHTLTPVLDRCQVGTCARGSASVRSLVLVSANLARMVEPKSRLRQNFVACGVTLRGSRETRVTGSGAPCSTTLDFAPTFNPNPLESFNRASIGRARCEPRLHAEVSAPPSATASCPAQAAAPATRSPTHPV